jgi:spore coat polysaccharide biosynthesis protein SpsF
MQLPFSQGLTIPQIIIERLKSIVPGETIVLCTTSNSEDDALEEVARLSGVQCFRGSEHDVLQRFLDAAKTHNFQEVIRVCADNPFLSQTYIARLIEEFYAVPCDYLSFAFHDQTPIMKGHIGLFAEIMRVDFLTRIAELTTDPLYREHVTNFVYANTDRFNARFLSVPEPFYNRKDIRLTIDTLADFNYVRELFEQAYGEPGSYKRDIELHALFDLIESSPNLLARMGREIEKNQK